MCKIANQESNGKMNSLGPHDPLKRESSCVQRQKGERKELAWSLSPKDSPAEDTPVDKAQSRRQVSTFHGCHPEPSSLS